MKVRLGLFAVACAALVWIFRAMLFTRAPQAFADPVNDMSFAWFVPFFSLYVVGRARKEIVASVGRPTAWGAVLAVPALAAGVCGIRTADVRLEIVGFVGLLLSLVWILFGTGTMRRTAFPLLFLLFCVPMAALLEPLTWHLRLFAATASQAMLTGFGYDVIRQGTALAAADGSFAVDVAAPCSGLRSLFALLALTAGYAYFTHRTWTRRALLFASAVPIALGCNVVRILAVCFVAAYFSPTFATGAYHDWSGYAVFAVAIALMLAASAALAKGEK